MAERLRAERRMGEILAETVNHKGGNPQLSHDVRVGKLPDGIEWNESSRWQRIAQIDDADTACVSIAGYPGAPPQVKLRCLFLEKKQGRRARRL